MKLYELHLVAESIENDLDQLKKMLTHKPLRVVAVSHKLGIGLINIIKQSVPGIKRFELHSEVHPADVIKFLKANEGHPILLDALTAKNISPENANIIKAAADGEVMIDSANTGKITAKVSGVVIALSATNEHFVGSTMEKRASVIHIARD